ncbi:MAG: ATP-binding protein [Candidatus Saganbacteria bacterium]|nr:ATP-binding protein [Candidatus Saganbacteria bacterium]
MELDRILSAKKESKYLDFKEKFDPAQPREWCEIIKDIVAIANSSGGAIVIGVKNDGNPSKADVSQFLRLDPAEVIDKIAKYTGEQFDKFKINEAEKNGDLLAILLIEGSEYPMTFIKPGTYDIGDGKQDRAFSQGTTYFRHGAKSEPANSKDLREFVDYKIEVIRKSWLGGIRKVVKAPPTYKTVVLPPEIKESTAGTAMPIRVVDDPDAPAYKKVWDENAYESPQEMLVGAMKSWKRDKTSFASEADLKALYKARKTLRLDQDKAECLLESSINRHCPFFFWAKQLSRERLFKLIERVAKTGKFPAPSMALKLAYAIGGKMGKELIDFVISECPYPSTKKKARTYLKTLAKKDRLKREVGTQILVGGKYENVAALKAGQIEDLLDGFVAGNDKGNIKHLDALLYGTELEAAD